MEIETILLIAILAVTVIILIATVIAFNRGKKSAATGGYVDGISPDELREEASRIVNEIDRRVRASSDAVTQNIGHNLTVGNSAVQTGISSQFQALESSVRKVSDDERTLAERMHTLFGALSQQTEVRLDKIRDEMTRNLKEIRGENSVNLEALRTSSAADLKAMREIVDEKLSSTLESRFKTSFSMISERLEEINKSFSEIQNLQTGVRDLNRYFGNVKTRGTWGEVSLENLLSQILEANQYETQKSFGRSATKVDFAVKLPGRGTEEVFLPIDAKFPTESYQRLVEASESGSREATEAMSKEFLAAIDKQARSVRDKYIMQPYTTDFAIIYLPVEGMFAEVVKAPGVQERLQEQYRIVVAGPTTIAALLNSLQMGFRTVALEKRNAEIRKLFEGFKKDFGKFSDLLGKTLKQLGTITKSIEEADKRTELIRQKLNRVGAIPVPGEEPLISADEIDFTLDSADDPDEIPD
ncbi:MAG: DNA recombination protein RmuC [Clostridiaceae bacterium]|jgi:DNA recombination protein RmuC|nr:DNA recombination protein RmuC [Clostridiaceae bacterium]